MSPAAFELHFRAVVASTPEEIRRRLIASVIGDGEEGRGRLEVLERGPDRYASRFHLGSLDQLRVVEWSSPEHAQGAIEHSIGGRLRLSARYDIRLQPEGPRLRVDASYVLTTPFRGLAFSFRIGRRRALARRLASSWLPIEDARGWQRIEIVQSGPTTTPAGPSESPA